MDEFIKFLDYFWNKYEATYEDTDGSKFFDSEIVNKEDYEKLEDYCWQYLIKGQHWNFENKKILKEHGYICYAGDQDSFGLLVACVEKDNKNFSFG